MYTLIACTETRAGIHSTQTLPMADVFASLLCFLDPFHQECALHTMPHVFPCL